MNKHTPGPWIFDEIDEVGHFDVYNSSKSTLICTGAGFYGDDTPSESESNARLIASAPTMLSALERVSDWFKRHGTPENQGIACDVFQAIDAAKGNP